MNKPEGRPVLPDLDKQIQYMKHLRREVIPRIKNLQTELDMITAIEQSLMAAKMLEKENGSIELKNIWSVSNSEVNQILGDSKIKLTAVRVDVLKAILSRKGGDFTISEVHKAILRLRPISKSAIITTVLLFKAKGLIRESKMQQDLQKRIGRPETKYRYDKRSNNHGQ